DANNPNDQGLVEYHTTGGSCASTTNWTALQKEDLRQDTSWNTRSEFALPSSLNNTTFFLRFRANSNANEFFRVDGVLVRSLPQASLSVDLSWGNGASNTWTTG